MSDVDIYDVVIVGGGLSSLFLAREITHKKVLIIDKAKSLGGRAATRRIGDLSVNQGLDQFVLTDSKLKKWIDQAILEKNLEFSENKVRPLRGINQWAKSLGEGIPFASQTVVSSFKVKDDHIEVYDSHEQLIVRCKKIVLSPPAPQTRTILETSFFNADFLVEVEYTSCIRFYVLIKEAIERSDLKLLKTVNSFFLYGYEISDLLPESYKLMSREELHETLLSSFNIPREIIIDSYTHRWLYSQVKKPISQEHQLAFKDKNIFLLGDYFSTEGVNGLMKSIDSIKPFL